MSLEEPIIKEYIDEEGNKVIEKTIYKIIYIKEDKWNSQKKYYDNNKDKIFNKINEYRRNKYNTDEEYKDKMKIKRREYYLKKKNKELKEKC